MREFTAGGFYFETKKRGDITQSPHPLDENSRRIRHTDEKRPREPDGFSKRARSISASRPVHSPTAVVLETGTSRSVFARPALNLRPLSVAWILRPTIKKLPTGRHAPYRPCSRYGRAVSSDPSPFSCSSPSNVNLVKTMM